MTASTCTCPTKKPVRGVFACFVFHSGDPANWRTWNFALVTASPFEFDPGANDKARRYKVYHDSQTWTSCVTSISGQEAEIPNFQKFPVGWLGVAALARPVRAAPERVLERSSQPPRQYPELTAKVPFASLGSPGRTCAIRTYKKDPNLLTDKLPGNDLRAGTDHSSSPLCSISTVIGTHA